MNTIFPSNEIYAEDSWLRLYGFGRRAAGLTRYQHGGTDALFPYTSRNSHAGNGGSGPSADQNFHHKYRNHKYSNPSLSGSKSIDKNNVIILAHHRQMK